MKRFALILLVGLVAFGYNDVRAEESPTDVYKQWQNALKKRDKKTFCELTNNPKEAQDMFNRWNTAEDIARLFPTNIIKFKERKGKIL